MKFNWDEFLERLRTYPLDFHRVFPPCGQERVAAVESTLGRLPELLKDMLLRINGAELFSSPGPSWSLFPVRPERVE
jgi:hypothetical protein